MGTSVKSIVVAGAAVLGLAAQAGAQDFTWSGQLSPGQTVEIKGINGDIRATAAGGPIAEVTATKSARRGNPNDTDSTHGTIRTCATRGERVAGRRLDIRT